MKWLVTISALPDRSQSFEAEARSSIAALRDVLGRDMIASALERKPVAALCVSVMPVKANRQTEATDAMLRVPTGEEALKLA